VSEVRIPIAMLAVCVVAAAFGFPYLFPVTIFIAAYGYFRGRTTRPEQKRYWTIVFWASVAASGILIVSTLLLHPFELFEPTQTPMGRSSWVLQ